MEQRQSHSFPIGPVLSLWLIAKILVEWIYTVAGLDLIHPHQNASKVGDPGAEAPTTAAPVHSTTSNVQQVHTNPPTHVKNQKLK